MDSKKTPGHLDCLTSHIGAIDLLRNQIFIGVAVSQASTLRIALTMKMGGELPLGLPGFIVESLSPIMAAVVSIIAALITEVSTIYAEANHGMMLSARSAIHVKPVP